MTTEKRAAIAAKIRALRAKTIENGCTEAEALSAIAMTETLMDRYRFEKSEIDQEEPEKYGHGKRTGYGTRHTKSTKWHPTVSTWAALARLSGVKLWISTSDATVSAFGAEEDVLSTWYYMDLVKAASETSWAAATHLSGYSDKVAFMRGFCSGVSHKVHEIVKQREQAQTPENIERGLVRIKREDILLGKYDEFRRAQSLNFRKLSRSSSGNGSHAAGAAGRAAGSKVSFGSASGRVGGATKRLDN
jgi:hypothetical protein